MNQIVISLRVLLVFTVITGGIYPLIITGFAQSLFPRKANGSVVEANGNIYGSENIGQNFTSDRYFHGRLSASQYNALSSGGSNLGPSNKIFTDRVNSDLIRIQKENHLPPNSKIPSDLITTSASGLDPHISLDSALIQAARIAESRKTDQLIIKKIIYDNAEKRYFNITGDLFVNVLKMNIELDQQVK